jgi:hypothetical protein
LITARRAGVLGGLFDGLKQAGERADLGDLRA